MREKKRRGIREREKKDRDGKRMGKKKYVFILRTFPLFIYELAISFF